MKQAEDAATLALPLSDAGMQPIADIEAIGPYVRDKLLTAGVTTRDELADLAVDEFTAITGQSDENAKALIVWARSHWFGNTESAPAAKWSTNDKKRIDPNWPFNLSVGTPPVAPAITMASLANQRNALKVVQAVTTQRNPGTSFRERERLKRKAQRWAAKVQAMPPIEREYVLAAIANIATNGEGA